MAEELSRTWSGGDKHTQVFVVEDTLSSERGYAVGPERALVSALLFDGIQSYMNYRQSKSGRGRSRYREAYQWVHNVDDDYVFSFHNVCEALGIDPEYLRLGLINAARSQSQQWVRVRR